ncbi:glycosyltransferase involved in cell wall biosynthesis [Roseimicrobium gellanilyticum]|uniref:Glycosyltransferase involved in cell wall biosynthesis n=1 Tax=Roseimicrobium gellanilyticum TaxID=748857 RepID=A0A366HPA3_9BACT|nr:glycosyltransferase involved in cell wall biosynthesis [Roseimicrobium gellanilyticum]
MIPTLNEAGNLPRLVPAIATVLTGRRFEIIIVDDKSSDGTPQTALELANRYPLRLIERMQPDGLSGAVLKGLAAARGDIAVVMDADFQHPPEALPHLIESLEKDEADFVVGSRHVTGASTDVTWGTFRKLNSAVARLLARPLCGDVKDTMSGFFGLKRHVWNSSAQLAPLGYKIGLEFLCKCPGLRVREIPIHFGLREEGQSKLSLKQQFRYLEHLSRLYDFKFPRFSPIAKFVAAFALTWSMALPLFLGLTALGWPPHISFSIALLFSHGVHALLHWRYLNTEGVPETVTHPWVGFIGMIFAELLVGNLTLWWLLAELRAPTPIKIFTIATIVTAVCRYMLRKELRHDLRSLKAALSR